MKTTARAMQAQGLKYFSALTPAQKDKMINDIRAMRAGVFELPEGLRAQILRAQDLNEAISERQQIESFLHGSKCFKHSSGYFPVNINEILKQD